MHLKTHTHVSTAICRMHIRSCSLVPTSYACLQLVHMTNRTMVLHISLLHS